LLWHWARQVADAAAIASETKKDFMVVPPILQMLLSATAREWRIPCRVEITKRNHGRPYG
jgi:hypothetical protein